MGHGLPIFAPEAKLQLKLPAVGGFLIAAGSYVNILKRSPWYIDSHICYMIATYIIYTVVIT